MGSAGDLRRFVRLFPAVKIATTTIPLTFFDFFTDVYAVAIYAVSPAGAVRAAAVILGRLHAKPDEVFGDEYTVVIMGVLERKFKGHQSRFLSPTAI